MNKLEIDPGSWSTLNRLLDEALDRPPAERVAWIETLGDEFAQLKPQLRELLAHSASVETGDFLQTLPKFGVADTAPLLVAGQQVGGYRLVRELGAGGMGSVWLAERVDGLIHRPIALKLPHLVAAHGAALADRMAREREILATLDHRNIAKLLDAGLTPDGQPFLALEYIEGVPIDEYCRGADGRAPLELPARLALFRQVVEAVAYAHGKLVVHRDLKPANILVTPGGGVKLLDFGIAKLLDDGKAAATRLTEISGRALTPDYASPEQILGEPLTVASDVYSLGVILFELLTGTRPYKLVRASRGELEQAIVEIEARRPSEAAPAPGISKAWRRALRGDLDTIVSKALKKQPPERYATANALADDITRHLSRRPVLAQPDSVAYRVRKFVARNKLGVSAAALVLLAVLGGAGIAVWQARVAMAEQRRADLVKGFLLELFKSANPAFNGGRKVTVDQLLLASRAKINQEFASRPEIRAELLAIVGENLSAIGEGAAAMPIFEEAAATAEQAFGPDHVLTLQARSMVLTARSDVDPGADVTADTDRLIAAMRRNREVDPAYFSNLLAQRTHMALRAGRFPDAVKYASEALEVSSTRIGEDTEQNMSNVTLLALVHARNGDWRRSLEAATELRRLALDVRKLPGDHFNAVDARLMHGMALADAGELRAGLDEMAEAIEFALVRRKPQDSAIGSFRTHLARYQLRAGLEDAALENLRAAVEIQRQALGEKSRRFAATSAELGLSYLSMRRPGDAIAPLQAADAYFAGSGDTLAPLVPARLAVARAQSQSGTPGALTTAGATGWEIPYRGGQLERLAGRPAAARELLLQALRLLGDAPAEQLPRAEVTLELGRALFDLGRFDEARNSFVDAGALMRKAQLQRSAALADAESWQARALAAIGSRAPGVVR
jgi:eukaryotic-like serine/threonine-protein kinase